MEKDFVPNGPCCPHPACYGVVDALGAGVADAVPDTAGVAVALALALFLSAGLSEADGDGDGTGGEKVAYSYAFGSTGTLSDTAPALAKASTSCTVSPPFSGVVRPFSTISGVASFRSTSVPGVSVTGPLTSVTELAVPGAETDRSRSPLSWVDSAMKAPAWLPAGSVSPSAGPSTHAVSMSMPSTVVLTPKLAG